MSLYIKLATLEYPRHEGDIRLEYPDIDKALTGTAFPCPATYAKVEQQPIPTQCKDTQYIVESAPFKANEVWQTAWSVAEKPVESTNV
jgi:hypothetical protein